MMKRGKKRDDEEGEKRDDEEGEKKEMIKTVKIRENEEGKER